MRFGYWLPVFGGWLRNVEDERMEAEWSYVRKLARASERAGFDLTLIAELNLNDIKGADAPTLDAGSTAAAPPPSDTKPPQGPRPRRLWPPGRPRGRGRPSRIGWS